MKDAIGITLFESEKFGGSRICWGYVPNSKSQQSVLLSGGGSRNARCKNNWSNG